jgi:tetratricopeptide (TPR) repeat protein
MSAGLSTSLLVCAIGATTVATSWAVGGAVETMRDFQNSSPSFRVSETVRSFVARGEAAFRNGRYEEAVSNYTTALSKQSPSGRKAMAAIYSRRCGALLYLNRFDKAFPDANSAIALDPELFNPYEQRGLIYRVRGQLDDAIRDYTTAIRLNPRAFMAFNNRGVVYNHKRQYERAIRDFDDAIRVNPNYANAYMNRGTSYSSLRQYVRALSDYTEAIRRDPKVENAHYNRGTLYYYLGDYDRAIADLNEAIRRNRDPNAYAVRDEAVRKKKHQEQKRRP